MGRVVHRPGWWLSRASDGRGPSGADVVRLDRFTVALAASVASDTGVQLSQRKVPS